MAALSVPELTACVLANALDPELLGETRAAFYRAAETDARNGLKDD